MTKLTSHPGRVRDLDVLLKKRMYRNRLVTIVLPLTALLLFILMIIFDIYRH